MIREMSENDLESMGSFEVKDCNDYEIAKEIFVEYSKIKGAETCFVSFDKEIADIEMYYKNGAVLIGYDKEIPVATIAIKKIDDYKCEAKRLYIKPPYRNKGYARIMLNSMINKCRELGYKEIQFTTKPSVMKIGYELYKRMGFEEVENENDMAFMRMVL